MTFHRAEDAYTVRGTGRTDEGRSTRLIFIAVPSTPEEDYIVQQSDDRSVLYAFLWRQGSGYRLFLTDARMKEGEQPLFCASWAWGICSFSSRDDMLAYYEFLVYPAFVHGDQTPAFYLDLMPPADAAPAPTRAN